MNDLASIEALLAAATAPKIWLAAAITLAFAAFGRLVHGVTTSGAYAGAIVCFALLIGAGWAGFAGLCAVFVLTWAATLRKSPPITQPLLQPVLSLRPRRQRC